MAQLPASSRERAAAASSSSAKRCGSLSPRRLPVRPQSYLLARSRLAAAPSRSARGGEKRAGSLHCGSREPQRCPARKSGSLPCRCETLDHVEQVARPGARHCSCSVDQLFVLKPLDEPRGGEQPCDRIADFAQPPRFRDQHRRTAADRRRKVWHRSDDGVCPRALAAV
jgi:hypothetical protein